jgi:tubulin-specific chaperone A
MSDPKLLRELTIKSNVVKRLIKEVHSYEKEAEKDKERVKKMEANDPDDYAIKKAKEQVQVSGECIFNWVF